MHSLHCNVYCATINNSQEMQKTAIFPMCPSIEQWIKNMVQKHNRILFSHRKMQTCDLLQHGWNEIPLC